MSRCKDCIKFLRLENLEAVRQKEKDSYERNKIKQIAANKNWVKNNPEKNAAIKKRYRENNPEATKLSQQKWEKANPEKVAQKVTRRRALKKSAKTFYVSEKELKKLYNSKCFFCSNKADTIDHVIPLSRGGTHGIGNLLPACRSCNSSKSSRLIMEWKMSESRA
jgi:5-methylcytosine-specific restriction endonuclease McrA